ncbi:alpha/beta hydrolase [Desulfobacula sp.]|uniref:alpha/beta hydrolase n=1 Tax=Desulfobacula sp. TaxID=2593537 RepID=UPI0025BCC18D|nr:alpha/beta hydrolase [Desulfobacula sp.]MBC2704095.1 alpha/beta hydrolase [Desulfobacula sp.]
MKLIIQVISFGIVCYSLILVVLYFFQDKLLFFPGPTPFGNCPEMEQRNARAETVGDIRYYLKTKSDPDSWIIIFHGNAGNACDRVYFLDFLKEFNSNLVVFEYPGYGKDLNTPGEAIFLKQALELIFHIKRKDQENLSVYLMGESLGTGVATWIATRTDIKGLILISPYTSIAQVGQHHYFWLPVKFLMKHKFLAHTWAGQTRTPAILFHGINDDIIPIHFARQQILNFKGEKELVEIKDCGHNDIMDTGEKILQGKIHDFILKARGN